MHRTLASKNEMADYRLKLQVSHCIGYEHMCCYYLLLLLLSPPPPPPPP
jgi:hypothetical protein